MIKFRNAYYCNLKLLLAASVIYGHCIEVLMDLEPCQTIYRLIYMVHMPLFAFLSELFLKNQADCIRSLRRTLPTYLLCQAIAAALGLTLWHTPWWYLWYLLSLSFWLLFAFVWFSFRRGGGLILVLGFAAGCLGGTFPLGRMWSLSRTVVFFPWFWLGLLCKPEFSWHQLRLPGLLALGIFVFWNPQVSPVLLYQASSCPPDIRLQCYVWALLLGVFVLSWCPRRRCSVSVMGADTMRLYLLHGPLVRMLISVRLPLLSTLWILAVIHLATRWHGTIYVVKEDHTFQRPSPLIKKPVRMCPSHGLPGTPHGGEVFPSGPR